MPPRLAFAALVVCLAAAGVASRGGDAGPPAGPLFLTGHWQRVEHDAYTRVWVGGGSDDSQRGVALVAHGEGRWHPRLAVLETDARDGPLRIVSPPAGTDAFTL